MLFCIKSAASRRSCGHVSCTTRIRNLYSHSIYNCLTIFWIELVDRGDAYGCNHIDRSTHWKLRRHRMLHAVFYSWDRSRVERTCIAAFFTHSKLSAWQANVCIASSDILQCALGHTNYINKRFVCVLAQYKWKTRIVQERMRLKDNKRAKLRTLVLRKQFNRSSNTDLRSAICKLNGNDNHFRYAKTHY